MNSYYLGVDGGATKTTAVIIDENKKVIGRGKSAGSNFEAVGTDRAFANVLEAVSSAQGKKKLNNLLGCLALAGVNTRKNQVFWKQKIKENQVFRNLFISPPLVLNDIVAALRSGTTDKNAIGIIAGTGSNCWGRDEIGQEAKSGGLGSILSDEGSAFSIGSAILHAVTCNLDGRGARTLLTKFLFDKYKLRSLDELVILVYQNHWGKVEIAEVADLCEIAAERGDRIAEKIIERTADDLSQMVETVTRKLGFFEKPFTVVTAGSVFKIRKILNERFQESIRELNPRAKIVKPKIDSAKAAALLAFESQKVTIPRKFL